MNKNFNWLVAIFSIMLCGGLNGQQQSQQPAVAQQSFQAPAALQQLQQKAQQFGHGAPAVGTIQQPVFQQQTQPSTIAQQQQSQPPVVTQQTPQSPVSQQLQQKARQFLGHGAQVPGTVQQLVGQQTPQSFASVQKQQPASIVVTPPVSIDESPVMSQIQSISFSMATVPLFQTLNTLFNLVAPYDGKNITVSKTLQDALATLISNIYMAVKSQATQQGQPVNIELLASSMHAFGMIAYGSTGKGTMLLAPVQVSYVSSTILSDINTILQAAKHAEDAKIFASQSPTPVPAPASQVSSTPVQASAPGQILAPAPAPTQVAPVPVQVSVGAPVQQGLPVGH